MQETLSRGFLLLVLSVCVLSAMALDPEACQERDSIMQSCLSLP